MTGTLYLIPNTLGDLRQQAGDTLADVIPDGVLATTARLDYYIAENAKTTRAFLKAVHRYHPLATPLQAIRIAELNVQSDPAALPALLAPLLQGMDAGLISEAGVPAVADPGADLVRLAHRHGVRVRPLVGPSSILLAIMASGLNGQSFAFNGYLPVDAGQRAKRIQALESHSRTEKQSQLFIETPYRNAALLDALVTHCRGDTLISVATGLTTPAESIITLDGQGWKSRMGRKEAPDLQKTPTVFAILAQ